jgi:hypothetical protein
MSITGGTWEVGAKWNTTVVSDAEHPDRRVNTERSRGEYGGALIAESIFNPEDAKLIAAAPKLAEALRELVGRRERACRAGTLSRVPASG